MSPATGWAHAQRVVYPNGTRSDPFVVSMCKRDLERFARRILDDQWPEWKGCLNADGRVDRPKMDAKIAADDFDSGSARMSGAHDGRFWASVNRIRHHCRNWDFQIGDVAVGGAFGRSPVPGDSEDRRLSDFELAILFGVDDESGWQGLGALGIKDPDKALARTVLSWLPRIEEWVVPPTT